MFLQGCIDMPTRHPRELLFVSLTMLFLLHLLVTAPQGLARETMESQAGYAAGEIFGTCFHDLNLNGIRDDGEYGIAGITLSLKKINLLFHRTEWGTTVSDGEGRYEFAGLRRGLYLVEAQSTEQWVCTTRNPQLAIVAPWINGEQSDVSLQKPVVQNSFMLSEFRFNSMDTHMYWDGTYLWLPETEYLSDTVRFSTNLIRLNPEDFSYTRYNLPRIEYKEEDIYPIVYEVVPSPSNSDILYISAPYGEPKAIYVFSQLREAAEGYRLVNGNLVYGGNNGARMAVTTSGGNDTIWITCNDSKIGVFDVASAVMTELHDFSSIAPGGLYGMAAVPAATGEGYLIHVASFGGKLLVFPSDLTSISRSMTIDLADYGVSEASLTALIYDEPYIWVAGHGRYNGSFRLFIMRYMPASQYDMEGECTFYWSHVSIGMIPSMVSYGNWVFAVVENFDDCYVRYLIRLDKTTGVVDAIEIAFQNPRIAASLGHDGDGKIYAG